MNAERDWTTARFVKLHGEALQIEFRLLANAGPAREVDWATTVSAPELCEAAKGCVNNAAEKALVNVSAEVDHVRVEGANLRVSVSAHGTWRAIHQMPAAARVFAVYGIASTRPARDVTLRDSAVELVEDARRGLRDWLRGHDGIGDIVVEAQWSPGAALGERLSLDESAIEQELKDRKRTAERQRIGAGAAATILVLVAVVLALLVDPFLAAYAGFYGLFPLLLFFRAHQDLADVREESQERRERADLQELSDPNERQAQKLFSIHSIELKRYYDQALRQRTWIFLVGILCILGGFLAVGGAYYVLERQDNADVSERIVVAVLGAVGAVLANFVAVVYLRMFSATVDSIASFHSRLVTTHHLHFANFLTAKIGDERLRDEALLHMSTALAAKGLAAGETREADVSVPDASDGGRRT